MLIDCHVHTNRYSACSHLRPYEACRLAIKRGLDAVVITEHQIQWNKEEIKELQREFCEIKLYAGLEVTIMEGIDLVIITKNLGLQIPAMISFKELSSRVDLSESFIFVAHLFRWSKEINFKEEEIFSKIHGIEMNSINILLSGWEKNDMGLLTSREYNLYHCIKEKWNLLPLYNTDSHSPLTIGTIANNIPSNYIPKDEKELVELLKTTSVQEFQDTKTLTKILRKL